MNPSPALHSPARRAPCFFARALGPACAILLAALSASSPVAIAQDAPPPAAEERASAWPKLEAEAAKGLKPEIEKLRRATSPEMAEAAHAALVALGPGVVPELLPTLGKEKDAQALARIRAVLMGVTQAAHTRLLAAEFGQRALEVRSWCLERCAAFPDAALKPAALEALARARAAQAKAGSANADMARAARGELAAAALCAASAGALEGFDVLEGMAIEDWGRRREQLRAALAPWRSEEAVERTRAALESKDRKRVVGALNLLSACGTKESARRLAPFLDDSDNSIRVAAINACRGIVDGEAPVENLPVFEAVELAKKWKERLR